MLRGPFAKSNKFKTAPWVALQDRLLRAEVRGSNYDNKGDCKYEIQGAHKRQRNQTVGHIMNLTEEWLLLCPRGRHRFILSNVLHKLHAGTIEYICLTVNVTSLLNIKMKSPSWETYKKEEKKQIVDFNFFFFFFCLKFKLDRVQKMIKFMGLLIIGMNMGVKGCCLNMWPLQLAGGVSRVYTRLAL